MEKKTSLTDKGEEHHTPSYNIMDNGEGHHWSWRIFVSILRPWRLWKFPRDKEEKIWADQRSSSLLSLFFLGYTSSPPTPHCLRTKALKELHQSFSFLSHCSLYQKEAYPQTQQAIAVCLSLCILVFFLLLLFWFVCSQFATTISIEWGWAEQLGCKRQVIEENVLFDHPKYFLPLPLGVSMTSRVWQSKQKSFVITDVVLLHLFVAGFNLSNSCIVEICLTLILGRCLLPRAHESELFRLEFAIFSCCNKIKSLTHCTISSLLSLCFSLGW